jgi:hypothetical protein
MNSYTPALLTRTSALPNAFSVSANSLSTSDLFPTLPWTAMAFPPPFTYFVDYAICAVLVGRIIDHHRRTFGCELFGDPCADSLRRSGYHCNFSV